MAITETMARADLTPSYLKANYLIGLVLNSAPGQEVADSVFDQYLSRAVAKLEALTSITILQRTVTGEKHDYHLNDWLAYSWLQLFRVPAISCSGVRAVQSNGVTMVEYSSSWIKLEKSHAQVQLVAGVTAAVITAGAGTFLPLFYGTLQNLPHLFEVDYVAGFADTEWPHIIVDAVCKLAVIDILQTMSDVVAPIGQTSTSLSIDGMSQSRSYTQPAFKARIDNYKADLFGGPSSGDGLIKQIKLTYGGISMVSF